MQRLKSLIVLLLLLVAAGGLFVVPTAAQTQAEGQVIGQPQLSFATATGELTPGTTEELRIGITNRGQLRNGGPEQYENRVTTARGLTVTVQDGDLPISIDAGQLALGNVPTGATQAGPVSVTIPAQAEPGTYEVPIRYRYQYSRIADYDSFGVEYSEFTRSRTTTIKIDVASESRFQVVSSNATAQIGETNNIAITLRNTGDLPASEASVRVESRSSELQFGDAAESTAYVGSWRPGETHTVVYSPSLADDATDRNYTLDTTVEYTDTDGIAKTSRSVTTGLTARPEQTLSLERATGTLRVGETGQFQAIIQNNGPQPIRDPAVSLSTTNDNIDINTAEMAVDDLRAGQQTTVNFSVDVSDGADVTTQQFQLEVEYTNQRDKRQMSDPLQANTRIQPSRDTFTVRPLNSSLAAGQQTTLELRVTNNRDEPLSQIEGKAFFDDPLSSSDDEAFIERLGPGESTVVTLDVSAGSDTLEKTYTFTTDFQYCLAVAPLKSPIMNRSPGRQNQAQYDTK